MEAWLRSFCWNASGRLHKTDLADFPHRRRGTVVSVVGGVKGTHESWMSNVTIASYLAGSQPSKWGRRGIYDRSQIDDVDGEPPEIEEALSALPPMSHLVPCSCLMPANVFSPALDPAVATGELISPELCRDIELTPVPLLATLKLHLGISIMYELPVMMTAAEKRSCKRMFLCFSPLPGARGLWILVRSGHQVGEPFSWQQALNHRDHQRRLSFKMRRLGRAEICATNETSRGAPALQPYSPPAFQPSSLMSERGLHRFSPAKQFKPSHHL